MKIIIAGDYCERGRVSDVVATGSFDLLFDIEVCTTIQSADYAIVNFEFPIVVGEKTPIVKCGPNLKGTTKSVDAIKYAGFKCATLANNHILDYGGEALLNTKRYIEEAGIDTVGVGENLEEAKRILYKNVNGKTLAIINCCEHEFSIASYDAIGANPLSPVSQYYTIKEARDKADYVLVIVHGGHEHWQLPSPRMQETYRFFIDCGADAVVNHHQHCYSGSEIYKGKPILYGLGNFCFDIEPVKTDDIWNYGCLAEIEFTEKIIKHKLIPIKQCDDQVGVRMLNNAVFAKQQIELNAIISDEELLLQKTNDYYNHSMDFCKEIMNPTQNRYLKALQRRHIIPSPVHKEWLTVVQNFTLCEAHRDKMEYFFENYFE